MYIITNNQGSFFDCWTGIGPKFTNDRGAAMRFTDKYEAARLMGHYAFVGYDVVVDV